MQIHTVPVFGSLACLASVTAEAVHTSSAQCCDERRTLTLISPTRVQISLSCPPRPKGVG